MKELLCFIGLNVDKWMDGFHCLNGDWILYVMIIGGILTAILYLIFSYRISENRTKLGELLGSLEFIKNLFMVFIFCAVCHSGHTLGKIHPPAYLLCLGYIPLVYFMVRLAITTNWLVKHRLPFLVSPEQAAATNQKVKMQDKVITFLLTKVDDDSFKTAKILLAHGSDS